MLNTSRVPDNATVASKWSQPPKIGRNKHPPTAMTVNYTPTDFPDLKKTNHQGNTRQTSEKDDHSPAPLQKKTTASNFNNTSTHSNTSATSAGTTFTKEDGQSLFTSLTESFLEDMKSQAAQQNKTISDLIASQLQRDKANSIEQTARRKEEAEARKEDADIRREQAAQITQLLILFLNSRVSQVPAPSTTVPETEHTPMDATPAWDSPKRSMDTDSDSHQPQHKPSRQKLAKRPAADDCAERSVDSASSASSTSSPEDYTTYNRQGRCISEITIEEAAHYAAEAADNRYKRSKNNRCRGKSRIGSSI
jgi:hypothetical protein